MCVLVSSFSRRCWLTPKYNYTPVCQISTAAQIFLLIQPSAECSSQLKKSLASLRKNTQFAKYCLQLKRGIHSLAFMIDSTGCNLGKKKRQIFICPKWTGQPVSVFMRFIKILMQTRLFYSCTKTYRLEESAPLIPIHNESP